MKKLAIVLIFLSFLVSCEKSYIIPEQELPNWLVKRITEDEKTIEANPKYYLAFGAWVRYKWNNEYYYEYWNPLSSTMPVPISHKGDSLGFYANDATTDYYNQKCCWKYAWKGPKYEDWMYKP